MQRRWRGGGPGADIKRPEAESRWFSDCTGGHRLLVCKFIYLLMGLLSNFFLGVRRKVSNILLKVLKTSKKITTFCIN